MVQKVFIALVAMCVLGLFVQYPAAQHTGPHAPPPASPVTYADDVGPLLARRCAGCHHPGGPAPFSVLDPGEVIPRAQAIVHAVERRVMPPWPPEPGFGGPFVESTRLSEDDLERLRRWAAGGAPRGDLKVPLQGEPPHEHARSWPHGPPDLVATSPEPFILPAGGGDVFRNFAIALPLEAGRFVRRVEFVPGNHTVTHHANLRIDPSSASLHLDELDPEPGYDGIGAPTAVFPDGYYLGWTPGQVAPLLDPGLAWRVAAGSTLVVELHMVPSKRAERVDFSIGLYFSDVPPSRTPVMLRLGRQDIDIPPSARGHVVRDRFKLPTDVQVLSVQPHAHTLARRVDAWATLPNGSRQWLISIRRWDFHNQHVYRFETPPVLPKGTTVEMEYTYDNMTNQRVRWGQYTTDEMGDVWLQLLPAPGDLYALAQSAGAKMVADNVVGFRVLLERTPENGPIRANLAEALLHMGKHGEALAQFRTHVRLEPASAIAHANLGTALSLTGRQEEALRQFRRALEIDGGQILAHTGIGTVLLAQGDVEGALAAFREGIRVDPRAANAHNNAGVALERLGRPLEALLAYKTAVDLTVEEPDSRYNAGRLFERFGWYDEAEQLYRDVLRIEPEDPQVRRRLAWVLAASPGQSAAARAEAVMLAEGLSREQRNDPDVFDVLGAAYASTGDFTRALSAVRTALRILAERGDDEHAEPIKARLDLYRKALPYVAPLSQTRPPFRS
jgi:tetratricopeptide (TPR) repeat protein